MMGIEKSPSPSLRIGKIRKDGRTLLLVFQLSLEILAVEASDIADAYALGALGLAGTGVSLSLIHI